MNIVELRTNERRSFITQRREDRRKIPYQFGSPDWLNYVTNNHVEYPTFDRRKADRRTDKRLLPDRRQQYDAEPMRSGKKYERIFLTPAERKLIEDLYLNDLE